MQTGYTVEQAAQAVGCNPRTVRRHLAAGRLPGAIQQRTATGLAWRIPATALDQLRAHLTPQATLCDVEPEPAASTALAPTPAPAQGPTDSVALAAVRIALESQAATIAGQLAQLDAARDDALWWRCEAIGLREQLDQARAQLSAAQVELAHLRAIVELHHRPTIPLDQLRQLRAAA